MKEISEKPLTKLSRRGTIGKPFRERQKSSSGNGGVPCKLNNENMNKHLGQFFKKVVLEDVRMRHCARIANE